VGGFFMNDMEEISLFELLNLILKGWKVVLTTLLVLLTTSVSIYLFFNARSYVAQSTNKIILQEQETEFGIYKSQDLGIKDFVLILERKDFKDFVYKKLDINIDEISDSINLSILNNFEYAFTVTSNNEEHTKLIFKTFLDYSESYINFIANDNAIKQFEINQNFKLSSLDQQLKDKLRILEYLETEINQTEKFLGNNIHPVYASLVNQLTQIKKEIIELNFLIDDLNINISRLLDYSSEIITFDDYIASNLFNISIVSIDSINPTKVEVYRFNHRTLFPISAILGIMLGVFIVFFNRYWLINSKSEN
jgi:hypothetical protein